MTICISALCTAGLFALTGITVYAKTAKAETQAQDILLAPTTYQQFLQLDNPTDVAVCENFTAIADGNLLYLYDKAQNEYTTFTHDENAETEQNYIKKIQFSSTEKLYYADSSSGDNFYELNVEDLTSTKISAIACNTFTIFEETLYFAGPTGVLYTTSLADHSAPKTSIPLANPARNPSLAFWQDELYFTDNGAAPILYKLNPSLGVMTLKQVATFTTPIAHIAIADEVLACTTASGAFYAYPLGNVPEKILAQETQEVYTSLAPYGESIYTVCEHSVREFSTSVNAFTDFEITANSARPNRLDGATDILLAGEKLFVADAGNSRISVFNTQTNAFETSFHTDTPPSFLASDGNTLLTANTTDVTLYDLNTANYGNQIARFNAFDEPLVGVASVYGTYYLASANYAVSLTKNNEGTYALNKVEKSVSFHPTLLSADAYGNLYTLKNGDVLQFSEEEFMTANVSGTKIGETALTGASKLVVDFHKTVYLLQDNKIENTQNQTLDFSTPNVYTATTSLTSFTFGIEENATYLLFDGNHLVKTAKLNLPNVNAINVENADEQIFSSQSVDIQVVKTLPRSLLVQCDLNALNGADYFPYLSYERRNESLTALRLGETQDYHYIAVFDETKGEYSTYLVLKTSCEMLSHNDYLVAYETGKTAWLSNDVHLYKFPYLTTQLTAARLLRGGQVTLLGEVNGLDTNYYLVEYVNDAGETAQGYVPQSYAALYDAATSPTTETLVGETEKDTDSVMRFVYLILGFAIICILVDFLFLRKKHEED